MTTSRNIGEHLRDWRQRRRLSQLDLALAADISARHLSFLETGRARPSRDMLLHLADELDVPLRERNVLLVAAGFAPSFPERALNDPALASARAAVEQILDAHRPWPALAIDRHWTMLAANAAVTPLLTGVAAALRAPPINVLRLSLHPDGLAPRIVNLAEWRAHLLARLRRQIDVSADPVLVALLDELLAYPKPERRAGVAPPMGEAGLIAIPFEIATEGGRRLRFFSTTTVFGTPLDITLSELALETFFPADRATAEAVRAMAG